MKPKIIPENLKKQIAELPDLPGVYLFRGDDKKPVYIGKAVSIRKRVMSHFRYFNESFSKEGVMLGEVRGIDFVETPNEAEALLLEASFVKEYLPKYNQELKDDKSYPFLKITNEKFPRLLVVRGRKADGSRYFGPYTSAKLLKQAVKMLRRLYPMRTCNPIPKKVCLMYHIGQCKGPCVQEISEKDYGVIVKELLSFLEGRRDAMLRNLFKRMKEYSAKREYENAKAIHSQIQALSNVAVGPQRVSSSILEDLQKALSLPRLPKRIEGFDISNIHGKEAVGSMVVMVDAKPSRRDYKRFKIKTVQGIDDYQMMKEMIRRRYLKERDEKWPLPDLVLIDGGKGHLSAAKFELDKIGLIDLPIISIAKQHEHLFKPGKETPYIFPQSSKILQLLMQLRDEAHRFAITYHRKLHRKEAILSKLDAIEGVGPKIRERLLRRVGSVKKIASLTPEDLSEKGKINSALAQKIISSLR